MKPFPAATLLKNNFFRSKRASREIERNLNKAEKQERLKEEMIHLCVCNRLNELCLIVVHVSTQLQSTEKLLIALTRMKIALKNLFCIQIGIIVAEWNQMYEHYHFSLLLSFFSAYFLFAIYQSFTELYRCLRFLCEIFAQRAAKNKVGENSNYIELILFPANLTHTSNFVISYFTFFLFHLS